jgi:type VI secretion system protein ImpF
MHPSRPAPVAPALLFDRLADHERVHACEPVPLRALDAEALRASVLRELGDLLDTRCPVANGELQGRPRTTLEYGVPEGPCDHPGEGARHDEMAERIRAAVAAYEPRLRQPRVTVLLVEGRSRALRAQVEAELAAGTARVPVRFALDVGAARGRTP